MKKFNSILTSLGLLFFLLPPSSSATEKLTELRKERREINRELRRAIPDPAKLDPELAKLQQLSLDASKAHLQAMDRHPALKEVNAELAKSYNLLTQAISTKNKASQQTAQTKISELQHRRLDEANKVQELTELNEASNQANTAYYTREKELLSSHPETKALVARLDQVNEEIQVEMKK